MSAEAKNSTGFAMSAKEQREIVELYEKLREVQAKLVRPDGKAEVLPGNVNSFLCRLLADLKAGNSVTILQSKAELTTVARRKTLDDVSRAEYDEGIYDRLPQE